ncbi:MULTISPECIES: HAD-IA family hydrolase [unclassified Pseudomonas]|uniref:HAD-IA family hydrolase n=1 Tax=unclassified Pseudomonas TaxID=196821 RepID=UPI0015A24E53|nr:MULTISPECIES: HAD-IA family hydrolase [unclassified Pseudomonas]NWC96800.1 HAD-IA family hydrolase [Pseudomonas sp. IPO3779]NWD21217.1 HAD-IA family hydrolase [Pseudomonas sp. IPO3778]
MTSNNPVTPLDTQASGPVELVLFDLLTALLDSWTLWNAVAGSEQMGRTWRMAYLRATYGCGTYRPYETLVEEAAIEVGLGREAAGELEARWGELAPWPEAKSVLAALKPHYKLGIVTNCSEKLGRLAADLMGVPFDVVITSEKAGFYKPDPAPYRLALETLGIAPANAVFVAGSAYDLFGTEKVGLPTIWHNRVGLAAPEGAPRPLIMRPTLDTLAADLASIVSAS